MRSRDISMGMRALALGKGEFLGIFDSLAKKMALEEVLKGANVGDVTGALWACGKVYAMEEMDGGEVVPSYVDAAEMMGRKMAAMRIGNARR